MSTAPNQTGILRRTASCPDLGVLLDELGPDHGRAALDRAVAPESAPGTPRQLVVQDVAGSALSELERSRSSLADQPDSLAEWEIIPLDMDEVPPLSFPQEAVRSDFSVLTRVMSLAKFYLTRAPEVELAPRCVGAPECLAQAEEVIRKGQFMGAEIVLRWIEQVEGSLGQSAVVLPNLLLGGAAQSFAESLQVICNSIQQRPAGKILLVPMVLAGSKLSYNHIVCLAISEQGLEYFDSQQTCMRVGSARPLTVGGSLGQLLSAAWAALGESLPANQRGRLTIAGNTETHPIQRDHWSCGVYVISYMRERMFGRSHVQAMEGLAHGALTQLHRALWTDLNQTTRAESARHSLDTLVKQLEAFVESGRATAFDEALPLALAWSESPAAAADESDLPQGFDVLEVPPLNPEILLQTFSQRQSVDCVGLCGSSAEGLNRGGRTKNSRRAVLEQAITDLKRSQVIVLEGTRSTPFQGEDEARVTAERALDYINEKVQGVLPNVDPHVTHQLFGICCQAPGASMYAALLYVRGLLDEENQVTPVQMSDSEAGRMESHLDVTGLHHSLSVPYSLKRMRNASMEVAGQVLVTSDFHIRWEDLTNLLQEDGTRLDLAKVRGRLTVEPLNSTEPGFAGEGSSSS